MKSRTAIAIFTLVVLFASVSRSFAAEKPAKRSVFSKNNLVAWCIVPFDAKKRGPEERAQMLNRLGVTRLAYDWRANDIPTFDQELEALQRHNIKLEAFWIPGTLEPEEDENTRIILDLLERRRVKTQIWISITDRDLKSIADLPQEAKVDALAKAIGHIARRAKKIGCSVALYNHGKWFGEPDNQTAIIRRLNMDNVGIVYNFHHGREQMDRFPELFANMEPYLLAVNLNGMKKDGPMILPVGEGDRELEMLKIIKASSYAGPIGILDHRNELDAELSLKQNLEGLQKLLTQLGDSEALGTY